MLNDGIVREFDADAALEEEYNEEFVEDRIGDRSVIAPMVLRHQFFILCSSVMLFVVLLVVAAVKTTKTTTFGISGIHDKAKAMKSVLKVPTPIFAMGLPLCGSYILQDYLECNGIPTAHDCCCARDAPPTAPCGDNSGADSGGKSDKNGPSSSSSSSSSSMLPIDTSTTITVAECIWRNHLYNQQQLQQEDEENIESSAGGESNGKKGNRRSSKSKRRLLLEGCDGGGYYQAFVRLDSIVPVSSLPPSYHEWANLTMTNLHHHHLVLLLPQQELLEEISRDYPHATFLLNQRKGWPTWIQGRGRGGIQHEQLIMDNKPEETFGGDEDEDRSLLSSTASLASYFLDKFPVQGANNTILTTATPKEESSWLDTIYHRHVERIRSFVQTSTNHTLLEVHVDDDKAGQNLENFLGGSSNCWKAVIVDDP